MLKSLIQIISPIHIVFIPIFAILAGLLLYRLISKRDKPAGLVLYLGLLIIVDGYLDQGLFLPFLEKGSIKYSEIVWLILFLHDKDLRSIQKSHVKKAIIFLFSAFTLFLFLAALRDVNILLGIREFRRAIVPQMLAFIIAITGFNKDEDYIKFFNYSILLIGIIAVYLLWMEFANIIILKGPLLNSKTFIRSLERRRYGSFFLNPNYLAVFVVLYLPIYLSLALSRQNRKYIYILTALTLLFMLSQTQSRGPILSCAASLPIFVALHLRNFKKMLILFCAILVFSTITMPAISWKLTRRLTTEGVLTEIAERGSETSGRRRTWDYVINVIKDHPFGVGLSINSYWNIYSAYAGKYNSDLRGVEDNPHNSLLQIALVAGIQGLVAFMSLLALFYWSAFTEIRRSRNELLIAMSCSLFAFSIAMLAEPVMFRPTKVANLFWILLGLAISQADKYRASNLSQNTIGNT